MKQWKFIPELGGGVYPEMETVPRLGNVCLNLPGIGATWFPIHVLTEVPQLPPEPETGAVRRDRHGYVWQNIGAERGDWCCVAGDLGADWEGLNRVYGPLVEYIPAPEPVELPWEHKDREFYSVSVTESPRSWAACRVNSSGGADLTPDACREMARALNTAADQAEAATQ